MKTAQDIIKEIDELPLDEMKIVFEYVSSKTEDTFHECEYSKEDIEKLNQIQDEVEQGINLSPALKGEEAIQFLKKLRK